jgi:hypothetical protein
LVLAAAAVGFAGVSLVVRLRKGTLDVTSTPPGAAIFLDGANTGKVAPALLGDLEGAKTYRVELMKDGFKPWRNDVPLKRGQHLVVEAKLEPAPPVERPPPLARPDEVDAGATAPALAPEEGAVPDTVAWPVARFELDAAKHRLDLSRAGALSVTLDPAKTYKVALGKGPMEGWGFYVVNEAGAQPGPFTAQPLQMKGVKKLYAFHVPAAVLGGTARDDGRPRPLTVQASTEKRVSTYKVPASLRFPATSRVTVTGLDAAATYELLVRQGQPPARVRAGHPVTRVVAGHPTEGLVVVAVGESWRFSGAKQVWLTLLDDSPSDQEGRLVFDLRHVQPTTKKTKRRLPRGPSVFRHHPRADGGGKLLEPFHHLLREVGVEVHQQVADVRPRREDLRVNVGARVAHHPVHVAQHAGHVLVHVCQPPRLR